MAVRKNPTLQTVAAAVGVSRSTVSNAYNRPDQLSPELRDRILAAAADLGYAGPDPTARSLRQGTAGAIGLLQDILWAVTDPANLELLAGVAEVCEDHGLALVLLGLRPDDPDRPDPLRSARLDGVIAHCEDGLVPEHRKHIVDRGLPLVVVDNTRELEAPVVSIDEEHGAEAAARHLADLGHRRVAVVVIGDDDDTCDGIALRRLDGYRRGFAGDPAAVIDVVMAGHTRASGLAAGRRILAAADRPTAILAMSDELAIGVIDAAHDLGLAVPADVSVVGFDDAPTAAASRPPLTTVHQDHREKGRTAVRLLLGELGERRSVVLPTRLVVRESTAPPAGR